MIPDTERAPSPAKNRLTYPDLLRLEWIVGDEIEEWKCRNDGGEGLVEKGQSTLEHIRAMIREDESSDDPAATPAEAPVKLVIEVAEEIVREAENLTRERCLQSLGETLAELAHDIAEASDRPGSWEAARVHAWLDSHYPPEETLRQMRKGGGQ